MAVATWVGGDGTGSEQTDYGRTANWSGGVVPDADDHVIVANTGHNCKLDTNREAASLTINSGATIDGSGGKLSIKSEGDSSEGTNHFAVNNDGRIVGHLDLEINTPATTSCDFAGESGHGKFRNVTINHASCIVNLESTTQFTGNLTITLGKIVCGGNTVEITGNTRIGPTSGAADQATLQCDSSAMFLGSGKTDDYGLTVVKGGTFTGGTGNHTIGSITMSNFDASKCTLTNGVTTINGEDSGDNKAINIGSASTFAHGNGTVKHTLNANTTYIRTGGIIALNNFEQDNNSNLQVNPALTCAGTFTLTAGEFDTSGSSYAVTVTGNAAINGGTFNGNASAISFGSLTISGGEYSATSGTTTITSNTATGTRSVYNNGGTFTHNKGTLKIDTGANTNYDFDGDDLYNFTVECEDGSGALTCDGEASTAVTVLNNLDIKMGVLRTNANSFTIHGNVFVRETSLTNKNKFVAQGANQTVKGLITVEDGAFFDMQNQGSGSFGTLTTGGIRVL